MFFFFFNSDENSMHKVMPKHFEKNADYYSQTVSVSYYIEEAVA